MQTSSPFISDDCLYSSIQFWERIADQPLSPIQSQLHNQSTCLHFMSSTTRSVPLVCPAKRRLDRFIRNGRSEWMKISMADAKPGASGTASACVPFDRKVPLWIQKCVSRIVMHNSLRTVSCSAPQLNNAASVRTQLRT